MSALVVVLLTIPVLPASAIPYVDGRERSQPGDITASDDGQDTAEPAESGFAAECALRPDTTKLSIGAVDCLRLPSAHMGAPVPVGYYIPPACDPALGRDCPVLYYLHGTGGSYRSGVGSQGSAGSAWVHALTSGPPVDPRTIDDPWRYADPSTWVPKDPIDLIIIAPHGLTLPGGHGPVAGADTGWFDWHPRYAEGGDSQRYDTPPPEPSGFLVSELAPFIDEVFPTDGSREQRAIVGYSQGGFGAYINGLLHPDVWASLGMQSGGAIPVPLFDMIAPAPDVELAPPVSVPYTNLPGVVPMAVPEQAFAEMLVAEATVGFGDVIADHAWFRHSNPIDLMPNARAWAADGTQSIHLKHFVNDAVPRRTDDLTQPNVFAQVYETLLYPMNLYMEEVFDALEVERTFHVGPGDHSGDYGHPYLREQLEHQYGNLRHFDGGGEPGPRPSVFDYRTIRTDFSIWGWEFAVDREPVEFLNLSEVTCDSLRLRGTGEVTVTVPAQCRSGVDGQRTFVVDLGPAQATDEPVGAGSSGTYGRTVRVELESRNPCASSAPPHCS